MKVIIFGAFGGTGSLVVEKALAEGHDVTAFVHGDGQAHARARTVRGDCIDAGAVERAVAGQHVAIANS